MPDTRLCWWEIKGKYAIHVVIKHAETWNYDRNEGGN
jgi:hypothetical protein